MDKPVDEMISWMGITSSYYWQVSMQEVHVGSYKMNLDANNVLLDSGTSLMYLPTSDFN